MTRRSVTVAALVIFVLHFAITSIAGHYIAVRMGNETGEAVTSFITKAQEAAAAGSEDSVGDLYQQMRDRGKSITDSWLVPRALLSFPVKSLLQPLFSTVRRSDFEAYSEQRITRAQLERHVLVRELVLTFLNSLVLGLLAYLALRLFVREPTA